MAAPHLNSKGFSSRCMGGEAQTSAFLQQIKSLPNPLYLVSEAAVKQNLAIIDRIQKEAGIEFIQALKAFSHYPIFDWFKGTIKGMTASSLNELLLADEEFGGELHLYAPIYREEEFELMANKASHITFNSLNQYKKYCHQAISKGVSCGIRINPEYSTVETDLYNPCIAGSRLGVYHEVLDQWPSDIPFPEGFHSHNLCESSAEAAIKTLLNIEKLFGQHLSRLKWLNLGGGHLVTREGYNIELLIDFLKQFKRRHPHLHLILEPGSAFLWQTGVLLAKVEDIVDSKGIQTAVLNVSFSCHMPDCLEMPYQPNIWGANTSEKGFSYRLGGCSCLAGDFMSDFYFEKPLEIGDILVFDDMFHYTMVKTTTFNGVAHPSAGFLTEKGEFKLTREYGYKEYKARI